MTINTSRHSDTYGVTLGRTHCLVSPLFFPSNLAQFKYFHKITVLHVNSGLTGVGGICSLGCGKVDTWWQAAGPILMQYRTSSVSWFTETRFCRLISVDSDARNCTEHALCVAFPILLVPLRCKENGADAEACRPVALCEHFVPYLIL